MIRLTKFPLERQRKYSNLVSFQILYRKGYAKTALGRVCSMYVSISLLYVSSMESLLTISTSQRLCALLIQRRRRLVLMLGMQQQYELNDILILIQVINMQLLRLAKNIVRFATTQRLRTQIFTPMTNKQLATPQYVKKEILKRLPFHSKVSLVSLFHKKRVRHAVKSCFSEKKSNRLKRVHKIKKYMYSEILGKKLYIRMSSKAYRCIRKLGSFDRYILLTKPKDLDSKIGEYYREIMLRKINDPQYRLPYILGSGRKELIKKHQKYYWTQKARKLVIPKEYKKNLITNQRKFGTSVDEFNDDDYQKYLEVEKLKKLWGKDANTRHPLLLQIQAKLNPPLSSQQVEAMQQKSEQFKQQYLNHPKNTQLRRQNFQINEIEAQKQNVKIRQAWVKHHMFTGEENNSNTP